MQQTSPQGPMPSWYQRGPAHLLGHVHHSQYCPRLEQSCLLDRLVSHPSKTGDFQRLLQPQPGSGAGWEGVRWSSCSRLWLLVAFGGYGPNSHPSALPLLARPSLLCTHMTTSNFSSSRGEPASCRSLAEDLEPPGDTPSWEPFPSLSLLLLPLCAAVVGSGSLCKASV